MSVALDQYLAKHRPILDRYLAGEKLNRQERRYLQKVVRKLEVLTPEYEYDAEQLEVLADAEKPPY